MNNSTPNNHSRAVAMVTVSSRQPEQHVLNVILYLVLIKHVEDKQSELGGVSEGEELLVDLLEAHSV